MKGDTDRRGIHFLFLAHRDIVSVRSLVSLRVSFLISTIVISLVYPNPAFADSRFLSWNTYLNLRNIVEVVNRGDQATTVTLLVRSAEGATVATPQITVPGASQRDVLFDELPGIGEDSYGTIEVVADASVLSRLAFYLPRETTDGYQIAYVEPAREVLSGESVLSYNTHDAAENSREGAGPVLNWLGVTNLSQSTQAFRIERYNEGGVLAGLRVVEVPPLGRRDVPADVEDPKSQSTSRTIGLNRIVPLNPAARYSAQIVRYGYAPVGSADQFRFAIPLYASGSGYTDQWSGISRGANARNWLELVNVSAQTTDVEVQLFSVYGGTLSAQPLRYSLAPFAQVHLCAHCILPVGNSGAAHIVSTVPDAVVARSVSYHLDELGEVDAAYSIEGRIPQVGSSTSSWNLFLGAENWLRLFNSTNESRTVTTTIYKGAHSKASSFVLGAHQGLDLPLHDSARFGTSRDMFGPILVAGEGVLWDLLRIKRPSAAAVSFAFPVPPIVGDVAGRPEQSIWQPSPGTSWQWQLTGAVDTSFDVDMYDVDLVNTPQSVIDRLKADGRTVICYFSAGTRESFRSDAELFPAQVVGRTLDGFADERWLDVRRIDLLAPIMRSRLDLAVTKRCDGVEPDNVDGYTNQTGFPLAASDQLTYNRWLATEAHARGLSVGLKNDLDQVELLVDSFDWALNEQCFQYGECAAYSAFVSRNKAVFGVEYEGSISSFCPAANAMNLDWLRKNITLDAPRQSCR